jgi:putative oxidoreductase
MKKDIALLLLRVAGVTFAFWHGWGKISALAAGGGDRFIASVESLGFPLPAVFAWAAALAEFVGGLAVALGLGTRIAASFAAFTMLVAAFGRHQLHQHVLVAIGLLQVPAEQINEWGNPEMAFLYLILFLAMALMGGGRFSLDRFLPKRKK